MTRMVSMSILGHCSAFQTKVLDMGSIVVFSMISLNVSVSHLSRSLSIGTIQAYVWPINSPEQLYPIRKPNQSIGHYRDFACLWYQSRTLCVLLGTGFSMKDTTPIYLPIKKYWNRIIFDARWHENPHTIKYNLQK